MFSLAEDLGDYCKDERTELAAGDYAFVPRGVEHAYLVQSQRARLLVTFSPAGFEEFFVEIGVAGDQPPADPVMPSPEEFARRLAPYGCQITGPPPELSATS